MALAPHETGYRGEERFAPECSLCGGAADRDRHGWGVCVDARIPAPKDDAA